LSVTGSPVFQIFEFILDTKSPKSPFYSCSSFGFALAISSNSYRAPIQSRSPAESPVKISTIGSSLVTKLKEAADSGDVEAQFNLAMSYSFGDGVEQNFVKAHNLFLKSANQGDARAQYYLGVMYLNGHGIPKDFEQAHIWFSKSAIQSDADAQCELGMMYLQGLGVEKNEKKPLEISLMRQSKGKQMRSIT
jgi:hypothetical protein